MHGTRVRESFWDVGRRKKTVKALLSASSPFWTSTMGKTHHKRGDIATFFTNIGKSVDFFED